MAGIDAEGTAYRMDGVPIRYKKFLESSYPDDADILKRIHDRIREVQGS
jgi:formylmethanofuran dehydrogenase subunit B